MELPHCSAMWWQHSRSAGVIVAPGRTHAMAGVIAHNKAIVSSANARVLVTLISVLRFLAAMNKFSLQKNDVSLTRTTTAVTGITASKLSFKDLTLVVKPGAWLLRRQASADPRSNRLILRLPAAQHLLETAISVLRVASRRHCPSRW